MSIYMKGAEWYFSFYIYGNIQTIKNIWHLQSCGMNGLEAMGMCKPSEDVSFLYPEAISTMYLYYSFIV